MARGLLTGSLILNIASLFCLCFSYWFPAWFVERTAKSTSFCWIGDGIYMAEYAWGDDYASGAGKKIPCAKSGSHQQGHFSTYEGYCNEGVRQDDGEPPGYYENMCQATSTAKIVSSLALVCLFISTCCMIFANIWRQREFMLSCISFISSLVTIACHIVCVFVMLKSPLFSKEHIDYLSTKHFGPPYVGFTCSFDSPLANIPWSIFESSALNCVFPGPSTVVAGIGFASLTITLFLQILWIQDSYQYGHPAMLRISKRDLMDTPELHSRIYSLYGASSRRLSLHSPFIRQLFVTMLPTLMASANAFVWGIFVVNGIQIITHGQVRIIPYSIIPDHGSEKDYTPFNFNHTLGYEKKTFERIFTQEIFYQLQHLSDSDFEEVALKGSSRILIDRTYNMFDFGPLTMIPFYWRAGAYFISITTGVGMIIWPVVLFIIWLWFYWVPAREVLRGRVLAWTDSLAKAQLSLFYILIFLLISDNITREITIPWFLLGGLLRPGHALEARVFVKLSSSIGSWCLVATAILTLVVGNYNLRLHRWCKRWEEDRRLQLAAAGNSNSSTSGGVGTLLSQANHGELSLNSDGSTTSLSLDETSSSADFANENRLFGRRDTPFWDSLIWTGSLPLTKPPSSAIAIEQALEHSSFRSFPTPPLHNPFSSSSASSVSVGSSSQPLLSRRLSEPLLRRNSSASSLQRMMIVGAGGQLLHPNTEALSDRIFHPIQGRRMRWSGLGKTVIYLIIFFTVAITIIVQNMDIVQFQFEGFVGDFVLLPKDRHPSYSIFSIFTFTKDGSYPNKSYHVSAVFLFFTVIMNIGHVIGLALMWSIPMSLDHQRSAFHFLELCAAWSAIDIFCLMLLVMHLEVPHLPAGLFDLTTPKVSELIEFILPFEKGMFHASLPLENGFYVLIAVVLVEKGLSFFVLEQAAQMISERDVMVRFAQGRVKWKKITGPNGQQRKTLVQQDFHHRQQQQQQQSSSSSSSDLLYQAFSPLILSSLAMEQQQDVFIGNSTYQRSSSISQQALDTIREEPLIGNHNLDATTANTSNTSNTVAVREEERGEDDEDEEGDDDVERILLPPSAIAFDDMTEEIFESEIGALFSPAARYSSGYLPKIMYAGIPRVMWRFLEFIGFLEAVVIVEDVESTPPYPRGGGPSTPFTLG